MHLKKQTYCSKYSQGFTLIEILVVIGMIAILATVVLVAINPARQFAEARNAQRVSNVTAILNAVGNRIAENQGVFTSGMCGVEIPTIASNMTSNDTSMTNPTVDIRPCLVPDYISELPYDPKMGRNSCTSASCHEDLSSEVYFTDYTIKRDSTTNRITVCAPAANDETTISDHHPICVTR